MPFPRLHLDPEHEMFRDQVRRYLKDNMADKVAKWRDQAHVDREDFKAFGDNGWLCLWAEEEYGGPGIRDIRYDQIDGQIDFRGATQLVEQADVLTRTEELSKTRPIQKRPTAMASMMIQRPA